MKQRGPTSSSGLGAADAARDLVFTKILADEAGVDVAATPPALLAYAVIAPYARHGVTATDIQGWTAACDESAPCFREKARTALAWRPGLGTLLAVIGGSSFVAAYVLAGRRG